MDAIYPPASTAAFSKRMVMVCAWQTSMKKVTNVFAIYQLLSVAYEQLRLYPSSKGKVSAKEKQKGCLVAAIMLN